MTETYTTKIIKEIDDVKIRYNYPNICDKCHKNVTATEFAVDDKIVIKFPGLDLEPYRIYDSDGKLRFKTHNELYCYCRKDIWVFRTSGDQYFININGQLSARVATSTLYLNMNNFDVITISRNAQFISWVGDNAMEIDPRGRDNGHTSTTKTYMQIRMFEKQVVKPKEFAELEKENNTMKEELVETKAELEKLKQKVADQLAVIESIDRIKELLRSVNGK